MHVGWCIWTRSFMLESILVCIINITDKEIQHSRKHLLSVLLQSICAHALECVLTDCIANLHENVQQLWVTGSWRKSDTNMPACFDVNWCNEWGIIYLQPLPFLLFNALKLPASLLYSFPFGMLTHHLCEHMIHVWLWHREPQLHAASEVTGDQNMNRDVIVGLT